MALKTLRKLICPCLFMKMKACDITTSSLYLAFFLYSLMACVYGIDKVFYIREVIAHVFHILPCRFPPWMMNTNCQNIFLTLLCDSETRSVLLSLKDQAGTGCPSNSYGCYSTATDCLENMESFHHYRPLRTGRINRYLFTGKSL